MIRKLELYIKRVISGHQRGIIAVFIKALLLPLSWLYGWGVCIRNWLYDHGWMRRYVPPVPLVISIGNIVAGGTGKTPLTLLLAKVFYDRLTVAILSRGYRSKAEKLETPVLLCEGRGPVFPASYCGDEPYLLAKRLPKATIIVGGNRRKAAFLAAKAGAQIILLDDGMQHRRLARDFDVVVIDVDDPFGQGYFLPRGFLREDLYSLTRAHLIVLNHLHDPSQFSVVKSYLKPYTIAPVVAVQGKVTAVRDLKGQAMESIQEREVGMFCGIANPHHFRRLLEREGFTVVAEFLLPDHTTINVRALESFAQKSAKKGAKWLICTEKDCVKVQENVSCSLPIIWVQMELQIVEGQKEWGSFLEQLEAKL